LLILRISIDNLPSGWADPTPSKTTKDLGTEWVEKGSSADLAVPSSIIRSEWNYLVNPKHKDFRSIQFSQPEPCAFDSRLKPEQL
jgi:RES domain-containing protein